MHAEEEVEQETYLAIVDFYRGGNAGGCAVGIYPDERAAMWAREGPWPNRRILGEFATGEEAEAAVIRRIKRYASGRRAWQTLCRRRQR
jgi:hypothetical protein